MILVGLDPGVITGYARADATTQTVIDVQSLKIHVAMRLIETARPDLVMFEDARKRKYGFQAMDAEQAKYGAAVREGAGSVKRDSKIWEDFLDDLGIPYLARKPSRTKVGELYFKAATGYQGRTSSHGRDAGMIIAGLNVPMVKSLIQQHDQQVRVDLQLEQRARDDRNSKARAKRLSGAAAG